MVLNKDMKKFYDKSQIQILQTSKQTNSSVSQNIILISQVKTIFQISFIESIRHELAAHRAGAAR